MDDELILSTEIQSFIFRQLEGMSEDDLKASLYHAQSLTSGNCGWIEYWLRDLTIEACKNQLQLFAEAKQVAP